MRTRFDLREKLTLVVLGRSGAGKGTQAQFLLRRLKRHGVYHIETGRFIRALLKKKNPTTAIADEVLARGGLTPSWVAAYTWLRELIERGYGGRHLVFDGAPRRIWEAELIDEVIRWHRRPPPLCIYVDVTEQEAMERLLSRGRADDKVRAIRNRLKFFNDEVVPVLSYYRRRGRLIRVNGMPPPETVSEEIDRALAHRLGRRWPKK